MIYIKEDALNKTKNWKDDEIYVLADFDRTITIGSSMTSWSVLSKSDKVPKCYVQERQEYYDYYRPIEIDESLDYETKNRLMKEWWIKHIELFVKYGISEEIINEAARDIRVMSFRACAYNFLKSMYDRDIPVIIISAGIGNFIKEFLKMNNAYFENIFIVSNFIEFKNGIASGVIGNITHSLNKNEVSLPDDLKFLIKNRSHVILLGDSLGDIRMVSEERKKDSLKIGFLEEKVEENMDSYKEAFDVVCTDNTGYDDLGEKIKLLKI